MPSLHLCMFLVLNSVSPHDFNSPQNSSVDAGMLVRLQATFFTLWLVIPYSWQFPAYFSFFQNPLSLLMHWWRRTCFTYHKKTQQSPQETQKKTGSKTTNPRSLIKITPLAAPQSGLVLQRPWPAVHMVAPPGTGSKKGAYCTSFVFQDLPPVIVLGDLDKIFQRENYVPFHWSYLGRKKLSEGWPESLQNALRKSCWANE